MFKVGDIVDNIYDGNDKNFVILSIDDAEYNIYTYAELIEFKYYNPNIHYNKYIDFVKCDYIDRYKLNINLTRKLKLQNLLTNV